MPEQDNHALLKNSLGEEQGPFEFATAIKTIIDIANDDGWVSTDEDRFVWRKLFYSAGAHSLNFGFTSYNMPVGGSMILYNDDESDIKGPFTETDNESHGQLWTPIVKGDKVWLEVSVPMDVIQELDLQLYSVNHDFSGLFPGSGSCHLDVACGLEDGYPQVDQYRNMISSVGAYHFSGTKICSGALMNNASNDCTPFFLTAEHCNVNQVTAPTVVVYWNYVNSYCRLPGSIESGQTGNGILNQYNTGATFRAGWDESDFTLIELDDPLLPEHQLYLLGWDRGLALPSSSVMIHHPRVEEKRISINVDKVRYKDNNVNEKYITVDNWEIGSSEIGSSGSPLLNEEGLVIGQLNGGQAACGNNDYDEFGWLRASWQGGGTMSTQLSSWLDPDGIAGTSMNGMACGYAVLMSEQHAAICTEQVNTYSIEGEISTAFSGDVLLTVDNPENISVSFSSGNISPGGAFTLQLYDLDQLSSNSYPLTIKAKNGPQMAEQKIWLTISGNTPLKPELVFPEHYQNDISLTPYLQWSMDDHANFYRIQIDDAEDYESPIVDITVKNNGVLQPFELEGSTQYLWRVKGLNNCGESEWSDSHIFNTKNRFCSTVTWDGALLIPTNASIVQAQVTNPYNLALESVYVPNIRGSHSYIGDISFSLYHQSTLVTLWDNQCGSDEDFDFGFSDISAAPKSCPPTHGNIIESHEPLSQFAGIASSGIWSLVIKDDFDSDGGVLEHWELEFCFTDSEPNTFLTESPSYLLCPNEDLFIECYVKVNEPNELGLQVFDEEGNELSVSYSINNLDNNQIARVLIDELPAHLGNEFPITLKAFTNSVVLEQEVHISRRSEGAATVVLEPDHGESYHMDEPVIIELETEPDDLSFLVEIATDTSFTDIVYQYQGLESIIVVDAIFSDSSFYYLRVKNEKDQACSGLTDIIPFEYGFTSDTKNLSESVDIRIYPNPTDGELTILCPELSNPTLFIFNCLGQIKHTSLIENGQKTIGTSTWEQGIYYAIVEEQGVRIIKEFQVIR